MKQDQKNYWITNLAFLVTILLAMVTDIFVIELLMYFWIATSLLDAAHIYFLKKPSGLRKEAPSQRIDFMVDLVFLYLISQVSTFGAVIYMGHIVLLQLCLWRENEKSFQSKYGPQKYSNQ